MSIFNAKNINSTNPSLEESLANIIAGASQKYYLDFKDAFWENIPLWMRDVKDNLIITLNLSLNSIIDTDSIASASAFILTNYRGLVTVVYLS